MLKRLNIPLLILPLIVFSFGFITLLSIAPDLFRNHVVFFLVGVVFYFLFSYVDYSYFKYLWKYLYIISISLLLITLLFAELRSGAARWLQIGPLSFQTSEMAKFALIVGISAILSEQDEQINRLKTLAKLLVVLLPSVALVLVQPDLGTTMVLLAVFLGIVFFAGINKYFVIFSLLAVGIFSNPLWNALKDYQKRRILVFFNPQLDVLGSGYNVIQSLIAVGSGGLVGKGFGRGTQANLQFLPAYWTDFIFASFAEEWGFLGVFLLVSSFLLLLGAILYVAYTAFDSFGKYFAIGVFLVFFLQFTINVGMNLGLMPVTGVTLPLVSYGGSSILFSMLSLGVLQNIWLKRRD